LEGGITRAERVEYLVLTEGGANKEEAWKRQELAIVDTAEVGSEIWGKNREFCESLNKICCTSPYPLPLYEQTTDY